MTNEKGEIDIKNIFCMGLSQKENLKINVKAIFMRKILVNE